MYSPDEERSRYIALLLRLGSRFDEGRFRRVYVNRDLNQKAINWIGFDMDYTLAVYNQTEFDRLCHDLTMQRMVERYDYPAAILDIAYDPSFAIRGLVVDRKLGHVLKVDAHGHVVKACHGLTPLPRDTAEEYRKAPPKLSDPRYDILDTLFELPEAFGYAAMVDHLDSAGGEVNYEELADQIRDAIDSIHADGTLKTEVMGDLPRYFDRDRRLGAALHRFRSAGKKLFLMTNSYYPYTNAVMSFLLENGPEDYKDWKGYFDVIITGAKKPSFFRPGQPFFILDEDGGVIGEEHDKLRRGVCYQHGNLKQLEEFLGSEGDEILYVGDHIYGDILRSKRDSRWRTVMVIPELEHEMQMNERVSDLADDWREAVDELEIVRDALLFEAELKHRLAHPDEFDDSAWTDDERREWDLAAREMVKNSDRLSRQRRDLIDRIRAIASELDMRFHPIWGPLMKSGNEHSIFGEQVERYACLYTSRVTNFLAYSPMQYHRAPHDNLPHEFER